MCTKASVNVKELLAEVKNNTSFSLEKLEGAEVFLHRSGSWDLLIQEEEEGKTVFWTVFVDYEGGSLSLEEEHMGESYAD